MAQTLEQQQAQMTEMYNQLPTEYQGQIQSALNVYRQQLVDQGLDQTVIQSNVWNYYTQCVVSLHQQYTQALQAQQAQQAQQGVASGQTADEPAQQQPAASQAVAQQGPAPNAVSEQRVDQATRNGVDPSVNAEQQSVAAAEIAAQTAPSAEEIAAQNAAEEERLKQQKLEDEKKEREEEEAFQKRVKNMDPILAARLIKQREKQRTGEVAEDIGSAAKVTQHVDPVLAKRWANLQEKQATGQSQVESPSVAGVKPWEERARNSELAGKWAARKNVTGDSIEEALGTSSSSGAKPWQKSVNNSELGQKWAKQQPGESVVQRTEKLEAKDGRGEDMKNAELAQKMKNMQEKVHEVFKDGSEEDSVPQLTDLANKPNPGNGTSPAAGERTVLNLRAGRSASHKFAWPANGMPVNSFTWTVRILDELDIDLEILALVRPDVNGDRSKTIELQKHARGGTFNGTFTPSRDKRMLVPSNNSGKEGDDGATNSSHLQVEAVMFNFSNSFSWINGKDVEIMTVFQ